MSGLTNQKIRRLRAGLFLGISKIMTEAARNRFCRLVQTAHILKIRWRGGSTFNKIIKIQNTI
jgi:hypothetical protein